MMESCYQLPKWYFAMDICMFKMSGIYVNHTAAVRAAFI